MFSLCLYTMSSRFFAQQKIRVIYSQYREILLKTVRRIFDSQIVLLLLFFEYLFVIHFSSIIISSFVHNQMQEKKISLNEKIFKLLLTIIEPVSDAILIVIIFIVVDVVVVIIRPAVILPLICAAI